MTTHNCKIGQHDLCTGDCSPHGKCDCECHVHQHVEFTKRRKKRSAPDKGGSQQPQKKKAKEPIFKTRLKRVDWWDV